MEILITGASGLLGGRLLRHLYNEKSVIVSKVKNFSVKAATRNIKKLNFLDNSIQKTEIDWDDQNKIAQVCEENDIIIHAAGPNAHDCLHKENESYEFYTKATRNFIDAAIKYDVKKFIFFSTIHVYANPLEGTIREDSELKNTHPYALSKKIGEEALMDAIKSNSKFFGYAIRLSNGYGYPLAKNIDCWKLFANNICRQAFESGRIQLKENSGQFRDFVPITNICDVIEQIIVGSKLPSGIYNLGSGKAMELIKFAELIKERIEIITGKKIYLYTNNNNKKYKPFVYKIDKLTKGASLYKVNKVMNSLTKYHESEIDQLIKFCLINFKQ